MKKVLSFVLCFVLIFSLLPGFAFAADEPVLVNQKTSDEGDLHMRKSLYKNSDGTYDITIESWATGEVDSQTISEAVPTDFVLILDQSGSMTERDIPATYQQAGTSWTPASITPGTYYYNVPGTSNYYQVYTKDVPTSGLTRVTNSRVRDYGTNTGNGIACSYNGSELYYRDTDGAIYRVYRDTEAFLIYHNSSFYYYDSTGARKDIESRTWWGVWELATNPNMQSGNLYTVSNNSHAYSLYYKDENGVEHQVEGSSTVSATGTTFFNGPLYTKGEIQTRLQALKNAVTSFVSTVESKADADGVNHRVAIVGFASDNGGGRNYENTELLTGVNVSGTTGRRYDRISTQDYQNALQDVTTQAGRTDLNNAINAIAASGGTFAQYGFNMAENVLENRTQTTYVNNAGQTANRNTVVIFFTDGHPGLNDQADTIAAANDTVASARNVKQNTWKTTVFSVGIFASGDDQPLTFALNTSNMSQNAQQTAMQRANYIRYQSNYLYFRGNRVDTQPYNDTIADYMRSVASNYPAAENFLTHANGTGDTGSNSNRRGAENPDHNDYYMRVTDAEGLQRAFEMIAETIDTSSTSATVDSTAVLRDTIYTGDFDASGGTVEAKSVKVEMVNGVLTETGAGTASPVVTQTVSSNGRLSVTGFDYSGLYVTDSKAGEKLVVTIKGLLPQQGGHLWSNSGDASIFPSESSADAVMGVASPEENIARVANVIDFNAPMIFASSVKRWKAVDEISNGEYKITDGNFTYQLLPDQAMPAANKGKINLVMNGVDVALALSNDVVWTQYTAIPAGSVYFDDELLNGDAIAVGDGSGYNENVGSDVSSGAAVLNPDGDMVVYFTFEGTGIDIYCSTASGDGAVQVSLASGDEFVNANKVYFEDPDGKYVLSDEGKFVLAGADTPDDATRYATSSYAVINKSETTRYNVPTVTFTNLPYGHYTVYLKAMKGCQYKLDGVRVYNPIGAPDTFQQEVYKTNGVDQESNARFYSLRDGLVNDGQDVSVEATAVDQTTGVLFVDNVESLSMTNGDGEPFYPDKAAAYKANSPKNEIYLGSNQAIALTVSDDAKGDHYWIGLSAPEEGAEGGTVNINGKTVEVTSAVDMYYPVEVGSSGAITVTNTGDSMISVTKLKVTSAYDASAVNGKAYSDGPNAAEPFGLIDRSLFDELVAALEDAVASQDTADSDQSASDLIENLKDLVKQLLSEFVDMLFQNVAKLFGK